MSFIELFGFVQSFNYSLPISSFIFSIFSAKSNFICHVFHFFSLLSFYRKILFKFCLHISTYFQSLSNFQPHLSITIVFKHLYVHRCTEVINRDRVVVSPLDIQALFYVLEPFSAVLSSGWFLIFP